MTSSSAPLVFVTVGTDHHPFGRLVEWIERWSPRAPGVRVVVQYGTAPAPQDVDGRAFVEPAEFQALLDEADAIVCSGGPGAIMETRAAGLRPIVVPRHSSRGEHVDDHQRSFADFMARRGLVMLADDEPALDAALDALLADIDAYRIDRDATTAPGIERIGVLIDDLVRGSA